MRISGKSISIITEEDIIRLRDDKIEESITLEYKRELSLNTDSEKKEISAIFISE